MKGRGDVFKLCLLGLLVLLANVKISATEYFVKSIKEFNALSLSAGDVVVMQNGVWESVFIEFEGVGTESNPITLRAETPGEVYFTGKSNIEIGGEYLVVDGFVFTQGALATGHVVRFQSSSDNQAYHCRLTNTKIYNYNPSDKDTEYKWVSLHGQYNRVDHCHFEGKNHAGAMMVIWLDDQPNYHQIDSNYFGARPDLGVNGGETIRIGTSDWSMYDSYTTVEGNVFEECDGEIEIISNKSCKNVYRNNTFRNSEGTLTLRHGNECEVYGNFFFGTSEKDCGGIRIIGEDHKVYNNYLQDIPGNGFRSAICLTNGVPDSPLNRYFQVINAHVVNNTIVNCDNPITIGAGVSSELSLPPKDCFISNNVVAVYSSSTSKIIDYDDEPENMTYQNNIMYGADLGITSEDGILEEDPVLTFSDFWRPSASSNVVDYGVDTFSYLVNDVDGQVRSSSNDAGCDQVSTDPIINTPLEKGDVGVGWRNSIKEVSAAEGGQVLRAYIDSAKDGDVIVLTTSGGVYQLDTTSVLSTNITIRAEHNLDEMPVIEAVGELDEFILMREHSKLLINGVSFNGGGVSSNTFESAFNISATLDQNDTLKLVLNNCQFADFTNASGGYILRSQVPVVFSSLLLNNVQIFDVSRQAFLFENNSHADSLVFTNCTFANVGREVLLMNVASQGDALATINHCTIDSAGFGDSGYKVVSLINVDASVMNSIFSNTYSDETLLVITGASSSIDYCLLWNAGVVDASAGATIGSSIINDQDVYYTDRNRYYFSLLSVSPALDYASDGENLGDLYWNNNGILNDNAYLIDLQLDNETVADFVYTTFEYAEVVSDASSYVVSAIAEDEAATVEVVYPETIPGVCTITVTAENNFDIETYTISLTEDVANVNDINSMEQSLSFYPNPCKDVLVIEAQKYGLARIYNQSGQLVQELVVDEAVTSHNISDLKPGYYHISYMSAESLTVKSLIVR